MPSIHFEWTFNLTNLLMFGAIVGYAWRLEKIITRFLVEHEILVRDYCKRVGIKINDLPTRLLTRSK